MLSLSLSLVAFLFSLSFELIFELKEGLDDIDSQIVIA